MNDYADKKAEQNKKRRNYMKMLAFPGFIAGIANYNEQEEYRNEEEDQRDVQSDAPTESIVDNR
jgi:hypothetical protein